MKMNYDKTYKDTESVHALQSNVWLPEFKRKHFYSFGQPDYETL